MLFRSGKDIDFITRALCPCSTLDVERLARAAGATIEEVTAYLAETEYKEASEILKSSASEFERWCDNALIRRLRSQKYEYFGVGPLAAYYLAKENELKSVRIILSGKKTGMTAESLRERVREMYV